MTPVQTGIVGLGYWGPNLLRNFAAQEECHMVWGCDLEEKNITKAKSHYPSLSYTKNYDDLLNDPNLELILIATPTSSHFPLAKKALEAGKNVFIEKPMASTSQEAEELIAIAKKAGKKIFVDHTFVFAPSVQKMTQMAKDGSLGELLYFDSTRINLGLIQKDTNVLWDLAIHDLSILSAFMDLGTIQSVTAIGSKHFGAQEEVAHLHLTFPKKFVAHIAVSWLSPLKIRQTILAGTKAMITYDDTKPSEKIRIYDSGVDRDDTKPDPFFPKYRAGDVVIPSLAQTETLSLEAQNVLKSLRGMEEPRVNGEEGLKVLRILEASAKSLAQGGVPVSL